MKALILVVSCAMAISNYNLDGRPRNMPTYVRPTEDELVASLPFSSTEQVLVIHDEAAKVEHLVMELRFDKADRSFGYIIPIPSPPTAVEKVAHSPFDSLRDIYTFTAVMGLGGMGRGLEGINLAGQGAGGGLGGGATLAQPPPPAVEVLDEQPMGSFTSFTLAVHDASELGAWLKEHDFTAPKAIEPWADRYARMGFSFVALKYNPATDAGVKGMTSETVRVSFPTPQVFFPYSEPVPAKLAKRLVAAWVIAAAPLRPIAREQAHIAQPWRSGQRFTATHDELALILKDLASVIPSGDKLSVQTYRDWKTSRDDWGDVLIVPEKAIALDDAAKTDRKRLLGLIDPDLVPPPRPKPVITEGASHEQASASSSAPTMPVASARPSAEHGCHASGTAPAGASGSWPLGCLVVVGLFTRMRRAKVCALALTACSKPQSVPSPPADVAAPVVDDASVDAVTSAAPTSTLSPEQETEKQAAVFAVLGGEMPDGGVTLVAGSPPIPPPPPSAVPDVKLMNVTVTSGPLDKTLVQRILQMHRNRFKYCYAQVLQRDPSVQGVASMKLMIGPQGDVMNAQVSFSSAEVQGCMGNGLRQISFPAGASPTIVSAQLRMIPPGT